MRQGPVTETLSQLHTAGRPVLSPRDVPRDVHLPLFSRQGGHALIGHARRPLPNPVAFCWKGAPPTGNRSVLRLSKAPLLSNVALRRFRLPPAMARGTNSFDSQHVRNDSRNSRLGFYHHKQLDLKGFRSNDYKPDFASSLSRWTIAAVGIPAKLNRQRKTTTATARNTPYAARKPIPTMDQIDGWQRIRR